MPNGQINRATEGNEDDGYYHNETEDILNNIDATGLLDNNGRLKQQYYNNISGNFRFLNLPNKQASVTLNMNNPITEFIIGNLFTGNLNDVINTNHEKMAPFNALVELINARVPFVSSLNEFYINNVKYLKPKKIYKKGRREKGRDTRKIEKIINPKTNRIINVDKSAFKKLYGKIKLMKVDYKNLSIYDTINYDIDDNCAVDLLTKYENWTIKSIEKILNRKIDNDITLDELIEVYKSNKMNIIVYDATDNIYFESDEQPDRIFKIYGDHIYLLKNKDQKIKIRKRIIKSIDDIDKYKNNKLYVLDPDLFNQIAEKIRESKILIEYDELRIPYKSNIIILDPYYEIDKNILNDNDSKCRSVYNMINKELNLTGVINIETMDYLNKSCKIRFMRSEQEYNFLIDLNKAYPSQLEKEGIIFPIPGINDYFEIYDKNKYCKHGLYYCTLNTYDDILAPTDDIYSYYEIEELKKDNRIKEIKYMYITSKISEMTKEKVKFVKSVNIDRVRAYIGWLLKKQSVYSKNYDLENDIDTDVLKLYYGNELSIDKNSFSINKMYFKTSTGMLSNMIIKGLSNIELYKMDKEMKKLNKNIKLVSIRTDSLGYFYENKNEIKKPDHMFNSDNGFWKIENKTKKVIKGDYKLIKHIDEPKINKVEINEYDENDIEKLINQNKSFIISGKYGTGKTYSINDKIIPTIKQNNQKYILSSITKENSTRINGQTIASLFYNKSNYEIKLMFENIDYLIIDEAPLLDEEACIYLDYLKTICKTKIILIGDENQIKKSSFKSSWTKSIFFMNLVNSNRIDLKTNHRCNEELLEFIEEVKKRGIYHGPKYCIEKLKNTNKIDDTKLHLCRWKKTEEEIKKNKDNKCYTIVKIQGETINEPYTIHNIKFLPMDQLITALSRAKNCDQIYIFN